MGNLTRFNAFDDSLDDLFRGFFVRPVSYEARPVPCNSAWT